MSGQTLLQKVWDLHTVKQLDSGQTQLFIALHLIHEVTSPQAFQMLRDRGLDVMFPQRTFATADHIVPTTSLARPFQDELAEAMMTALEHNTRDYNIPFFGPGTGAQGIVHVIGPELGLVQPGMTIACGDSHTSTHGAFGNLSFGIGTSQVRDVLATQTLALSPLKVRRIDTVGDLERGVTAKDVILYIIAKLGVNGGVGYAYEYGGDVFDRFSMEERMTACNMTIEGGARAGYVNPDETTFAYLKGRPYAPDGAAWDSAVERWRSFASDPDAEYDDRLRIDAEVIPPMVTWGINPGQAIGVDERIPSPSSCEDRDERELIEHALRHMQFKPERPIAGTPVDVAFIGSCTNSRLSDLQAAADVVSSHGGKVSARVKAIVVPGSEQVRNRAQELGLHEIFLRAGFEWREAGCSMCLAMNPDKLEGDQLSISSSNRNFIGRQGSPTGRTLLASPAMVALAALEGHVADVRELNGKEARYVA